jgi:DNA-3-methyladenine glycosylase II
MLIDQVSWMAARAINNRFRGLFGYKEDDEEGFPSPADVYQKDVLVLKSAGLSMRKAEYGELPQRHRQLADNQVKSLAEHFLSGKLSTELLRHGTDEEITKALIAVRGIGQVREPRMKHLG